MPDDIDHEPVLEASIPFISPFVSEAVDWTPLKKLNSKFTKFDIHRPKDEDVRRARGSVEIEHTLALRGTSRLRERLNRLPYVHALGAVTGNQAVQMARVGLPAIYASGWQCAADANLSGETYSDQSLYPSNSMPALVKRINNALLRQDQIECVERGEPSRDWLSPIIADAEAGFGGPLNVFELTKQLIAAGVAGIHYEDQLSSEKKCGHLGGKVLVPRTHFIRTLKAARLAAEVCGVDTVIIARTDARSAKIITTDVDDSDRYFIDSDESLVPLRTSEGFYKLRENSGLESAISRGLSYAPYCDMLWMETSTPDLDEARAFAEGVHGKFPGKPLAYNCSPSFSGWSKGMTYVQVSSFQRELAGMGYKFQFITLAGFHSLNLAMFKLAHDYQANDMGAYRRLQQCEFSEQENGYTAVRHQREVGTGYFDHIADVVSGGESSTTALEDSTESEQF